MTPNRDRDRQQGGEDPESEKDVLELGQALDAILVDERRSQEERVQRAKDLYREQAERIKRYGWGLGRVGLGQGSGAGLGTERAEGWTQLNPGRRAVGPGGEGAEGQGPLQRAGRPHQAVRLGSGASWVRLRIRGGLGDRAG